VFCNYDITGRERYISGERKKQKRGPFISFLSFVQVMRHRRLWEFFFRSRILFGFSLGKGWDCHDEEGRKRKERRGTRGNKKRGTED